ncbi:cytochrome c1 [Parvibaculum sp.]|uniref:cytochrome c1 n=1 Tax=Parvibaculum sp. TaxID=2024848 RepID=UPI00329A0A77
MKSISRAVSLAAIAAIGFSLFSGVPAKAAEGEVAPIDLQWSFEGVFGTYDRDALRRGYKVYKEVCAVCHSMEFVHFRNLGEPGGPEFSEGQVKALASEITVEDGPDAAGDMFERPGEGKDPFPSPYPNPEAAAASLGAVPPDLSLLAKSRAGGVDYLYSVLVGYEEAPEDFELTTGYYNKYFSGHMIAMPPPLSDGQVDYEDGTPNTVEQMSRDVTHFMMWAAEPKLEQRHRMGFQVLIYLVLLSGILYFAMRKVWADQH